MNGDDLRAWRKRERVSMPLLARNLDMAPRTLYAYEAVELRIPETVALACETLGYPGRFIDRTTEPATQSHPKGR